MAKVTQAYAKIAALNPDGYLFYNLYAIAEGYTNKGTHPVFIQTYRISESETYIKTCRVCFPYAITIIDSAFFFFIISQIHNFFILRLSPTRFDT